MSAFIELAFLSDHSPAQGKALKEGADSAMEIILCSTFLPPNNSQQHLQDQDWDWLWWLMLKRQAWLCCPKGPSSDAHWADGGEVIPGCRDKSHIQRSVDWMNEKARWKHTDLICALLYCKDPSYRLLLSLLKYSATAIGFKSKMNWTLTDYSVVVD